MRLLISGAGRGGTNLLTELVRSLTTANFSQNVEDRNIMEKPFPENYGTKLAIENVTFTENNLIKLMDTYDDLYLIFSVRNPIDNCLSKIVRGQSKSKGGDNDTEETAPDATIEGATDSITRLYKLINMSSEKYPKRVFVVRMEDIITKSEEVVNTINSKLKLTESKTYTNFQNNNRNRYQKGRYGNKLDTSQIDIYKQDNPFNGFFNGTNTIDKIKDELKEIMEVYYGV